MELTKIKSCAKEDILFDRLGKPIYPGVSCLYISSTNTICIGTIEKIYLKTKMVKIYEINKRKQLKSILNAQSMFDNNELFARETDFKSKLEQDKKEEDQRVRFKCIAGYFQDKNIKGLFYLQINSDPGKNVTTKNIKDSINSFKEKYKDLSIRVFTKQGESTNISDAKIYSERDYLSEMCCSQICLYDYKTKKPYLTEIKDLKDNTVYLIPFLKIVSFRNYFPNAKVKSNGLNHNTVYYIFRSFDNNNEYYPYSQTSV